MFLSAGLPLSLESTSEMNKSLKAVHTYSGYSADKKYILVENEFALVGTRTRSLSITESNAVVLFAPGQPGALGNALPWAASQSAGAVTSWLAPWSTPPWKAENAGLAAPG